MNEWTKGFSQLLTFLTNIRWIVLIRYKICWNFALLLDITLSSLECQHGTMCCKPRLVRRCTEVILPGNVVRGSWPLVSAQQRLTRQTGHRDCAWWYAECTALGKPLKQTIKHSAFVSSFHMLGLTQKLSQAIRQLILLKRCNTNSFTCIMNNNQLGFRINHSTESIHSFIPAISIAPLQVIYYLEALPTTARILYLSFMPKRTGNCW